MIGYGSFPPPPPFKIYDYPGLNPSGSLKLCSHLFTVQMLKNGICLAGCSGVLQYLWRYMFLTSDCSLDIAFQRRRSLRLLLQLFGGPLFRAPSTLGLLGF